jgi:hypothetical protein
MACTEALQRAVAAAGASKPNAHGSAGPESSRGTPWGGCAVDTKGPCCAFKRLLLAALLLAVCLTPRWCGRRQGPCAPLRRHLMRCTLVEHPPQKLPASHRGGAGADLLLVQLVVKGPHACSSSTAGARSAQHTSQSIGMCFLQSACTRQHAAQVFWVPAGSTAKAGVCPSAHRGPCPRGAAG